MTAADGPVPGATGSRSPLVTVYLPTHNRAALLRQAIRSVLAQDHRELELIVVDDGSTDGTQEVLAAFAAADPRLRVLRNERPAGAPAARNRAILDARGEFVTGIDDDDLMLPDRISALLAAHDDRYAFVCGASYVIGADGRWYDVHDAVEGRVELDELLLRNVVGNQVLLRTARLREAGLFDEAQPAWQDYELWTRLVLRHGPAWRIAEPTYVRRATIAHARITGSPAAIEGARRYYALYENHMGDAQRRSQRLLQAAVAGRRLTLAQLRDGLAAAETRPYALRYWLRSNAPALVRAYDAWRHSRRPVTQLPAAVRELLEAGPRP